MGTPQPVLQKINREVVQFIHTPEMRERLALEATEPAPPNTPDEFRAAFARQVAMWERFVKTSGVKF
jgi:tripartite-type tricarboxylate transporter receptor subunit TctC